MPEIMTDADLRNAPAVDDPCRFRMTEVGFPLNCPGFIEDSVS